MVLPDQLTITPIVLKTNWKLFRLRRIIGYWFKINEIGFYISLMAEI